LNEIDLDNVMVWRKS